MEKVKKNSLFPPLAKPQPHQQKQDNWKLSSEGQKVMSELEKRSRYYRQMRNRICAGYFEDGSEAAKEDEFELKRGSFCIACEQRISLQPSRKLTVNNINEFDRMNRRSMRQCVCILCKKVLTPTPHGLRQVSTEPCMGSRKDLSVEGQSSGWKDYTRRWNLKHQEDSMADFHISAMDYDSRLVSLQSRPDIEQQMPPKEVMLKSEKKCQSWLTKNHDYF